MRDVELSCLNIDELQDVWVRDYDDLPWVKAKLLFVRSGVKYPYRVLTAVHGEYSFGWYRQIVAVDPYYVDMRAMTHKECFELCRLGVVFRSVNGMTTSNWMGHYVISDWTYCLMSDLSDDVENSEWKKLEVQK